MMYYFNTKTYTSKNNNYAIRVYLRVVGDICKIFLTLIVPSNNLQVDIDIHRAHSLQPQSLHRSSSSNRNRNGK